MFTMNYYGYETELNRDVKRVWVEWRPHLVVRVEYADGNQSGHPILDVKKPSLLSRIRPYLEARR